MKVVVHDPLLVGHFEKLSVGEVEGTKAVLRGGNCPLTEFVNNKITSTPKCFIFGFMFEEFQKICSKVSRQNEC